MYEYVMNNPLLIFLVGMAAGLVVAFVIGQIHMRLEKGKDKAPAKLGPLSPQDNLKARVQLKKLSKNKGIGGK